MTGRRHVINVNGYTFALPLYDGLSSAMPASATRFETIHNSRSWESLFRQSSFLSCFFKSSHGLDSTNTRSEV